MIRYDFPLPSIMAEIQQLDATWVNKAATRTAHFVSIGKFEDSSPIWSVVKPVYMRLQNFKCVFCERALEGPEYGNIEYDLEHFRPKSAVKVWPSGDSQYNFATGAVSAKGYYWLAYEKIQNYAASCKVCNSPLKSNYFPIGGARKTSPGMFSALANEKPFLCYPFGSIDEDPERLVTFVATTAVPAAQSGERNRRGKVIIDFFKLNEREQLHVDRARMIALLGGALSRLDQPGLANADRVRLQKVVAASDLPKWPHAACSRAFRRMWADDPQRAKRIYSLCEEYVATGDRTGLSDV